MPSTAGEAESAAPQLVLPLRWRALTRLPTLGALLSQAQLVWPAVNQPVVEVEREEAAELAWTQAPDLLFAEVETEAELLQLAWRAVASDVAALFFVGPGVRRAAVVEAQGYGRSVAVVSSVSPSLLAAAGRVTEDLVRRRAYRQLLAYWRAEASRHVEALARYDLAELVRPPARPNMAPLSTILGAHVAGVLGLWWPTEPKAAARLELSPGALRRTLRRVPAGLVSATRPEAVSARVLVVEDNRLMARAAVRAFEQAAQRAGGDIRLQVAASAAEAQRLVAAGDAPDVAWIDVHLEAPSSGMELVRWLRRAKLPTVVVGKSAGAELETVRTLTRLGALSVWSGEGGPPAHPAEDALLAADDAAQIVALEEEMDRHAQGGLAAALHRGGAEAARSIVQLLEDDLRALIHPSIGDPTLSCPSMEARVARLAMEETGGNRTEAAQLIGVDRKTLGRLLGE